MIDPAMSHNAVSLPGSQRPIPRVVYQLALGQRVPERLVAVRECLIAKNPNWHFRLLDDEAVEEFVNEAYGPAMLARYLKIRPCYGAARADLARYLIIYRMGGLYLDLKSTADRPLDEVILKDDHYLLSQWRNRHGEKHFTWGVHRELRDVSGGALQQWFIASAPGHPFLEAVIHEVCSRTDRYDPWRDGVGGTGVFYLTGPMAYTRAIWPIRHQYPHRMLRNETEGGLVYSTSTGLSHRMLSADHYARRYDPLIGPIPTGGRAVALAGWQRARDQADLWWLRWRRITGQL